MRFMSSSQTTPVVHDNPKVKVIIAPGVNTQAALRRST